MGDLSKHFSRWEFKCKCGCGKATADKELVDVLEDLREHFGGRIDINSAHRCIAYNKQVGGTDGSKHLEGIASDIVIDGVHPDDVANYLKEKYEGKYGVGMYDTFTHIDVRESQARWDYRSE